VSAPPDMKGLAEAIFQSVPFLSWIGVEIVEATPDHVIAAFKPRDELIGNPHQQILHGGIISAVMDSVGGLVGILKYLETVSEEEKQDAYAEAFKRVTKFATIDMRADFLSPGRGTGFVCEGRILRLGRHVVVSRMEFRNGEGTLIAVGTGTYNY